ncbi:14681_t:CDS:2 [Cetraspora pellucida]|uniref:14681_t:CDS:1 n=1 Tax=Cetraspora pellucida TaxID=1433469 RepID=A0ACA9MKQ3_9GLOM|nr:14681_t:CDS:2 [Cetraspora pellucida]
MYKPISNAKEKSTICKQVEKGNIKPDQLYCCKNSDKSCFLYSPSCVNVADSGNEVAKCYNVGSSDTFDACRRTDANAARVCGWQVSRNKLGDTLNNVTACDKGQGYQLCDSTNSSVAYVTCGDLFRIGRNLALATYIPLGIICIGVGIIATFFYRSRKRRGKRLKEYQDTINEQKEELRKHGEDQTE